MTNQDTNQNTNQEVQEVQELDELQKKLSLLPVYVLDWLCSPEVTNNNAAIIEKFNLSGKNSLLAKLTREMVTKEILVERLPEAIQQRLTVDNNLAKNIAIEVAVKQLLPIRDYFANIEKLIIQWGGAMPSTFPPQMKTEIKTPTGTRPATSSVSSSSIQPSPRITQKSLRQIVQDNKEALNQGLTVSPLKIADFEQPVRGTIKNWLSDYVKQKGAEKHDQMIRSDYLFKNDNAKNLPPQEKPLVAEILKSYDENSTLPYNEEEKRIILEGLEKNPSRPQESSTAPASFANSSQAYREPIEEKDLSGPTELPPPPRSDAQINAGRVINLKDLQ